MTDITIALDHAGSMSLQDQLRRQIVEAIYAGALRPGQRIPSSRALAGRLGVSRNTVVLAYEDLIADGHLESRDRSGIFVLQKSVDGRIVGRRSRDASESPVAEVMTNIPADTGVRCPQQWRHYPYPFWDGRVDPALLPVQEWRKATRLASCPRDVMQWSEGNGELDDPMLVDELRTKVLPEQGIHALPGEVLVIHSVRQGLQFLLELLAGPDVPVWLEEPVDAELLATLRGRGTRIGYFSPASPADPPAGAILVTSARSGIATGKRISPERMEAITRNRGIVIEVTMPPDTLEPGAITPSLYANSDSGRVICVGSLSPVASCGAPPAYVVADTAVIASLRRRRRVSGVLPDLMQQRAWAYFLALGHYAAALHKSRRVLTARKTALRDALNHYLHAIVDIETVAGASVYWVHCRECRRLQALASQAAGAGVLIRPTRLSEVRGAFTMSVTGIPEQSIREGVRTLARILRTVRVRGNTETETHKMLTGAALRRAIAGKTLLYNTVYGEPCTIEVHRSGKLTGTAGYANDDLDCGRWWVEDHRWFRQWNHWAYGEAEGFHVAVADDSIYWYDASGQLVDQAIILAKTRRKAAPRA